MQILVKKIPSKKGWLYSTILRDNLIARKWGFSPSQFRALPVQDKAEMIATERAEAKMQSYDYYLLEKKRNRKGKK